MVQHVRALYSSSSGGNSRSLSAFEVGFISYRAKRGCRPVAHCPVGMGPPLPQRYGAAVETTAAKVARLEGGLATAMRRGALRGAGYFPCRPPDPPFASGWEGWGGGLLGSSASRSWLVGAAANSAVAAVLVRLPESRPPLLACLSDVRLLFCFRLEIGAKFGGVGGPTIFAFVFPAARALRHIFVSPSALSRRPLSPSGTVASAPRLSRAPRYADGFFAYATSISAIPFEQLTWFRCMSRPKHVPCAMALRKEIGWWRIST